MPPHRERGFERAFLKRQRPRGPPRSRAGGRPRGGRATHLVVDVVLVGVVLVEDQPQKLARRIHVHRLQLPGLAARLPVVTEGDVPGGRGRGRVGRNAHWSGPAARPHAARGVSGGPRGARMNTLGREPGGSVLLGLLQAGSACAGRADPGGAGCGAQRAGSRRQREPRRAPHALSPAYPSLRNRSAWRGAKHSGRLSLT